MGILIAIWIGSGVIFGVTFSLLLNQVMAKVGSFRPYDRFVRMTMGVGLAGYIIMGVCYDSQVTSFTGYCFLMVMIGVGSVGFYGVTFLTLVESYYPLSSLLIGNLLAVGASIYSALATAMGEYIRFMNPYYSMAAICALPFIYLHITFRTQFKRYRYHRDEKNNRYALLKISDYRALFHHETKFE